MKKKKSNTCIAAIKHRGKIYMAGDRRMTWDDGQAQRSPVPKVIKKNGILLGGTGSSYLLSLITRCLQLEKPKTNIDTYMYFTFKEKLKKLLINQGMGEKESLQLPKDLELELLVAVKGSLWTVVIEKLEEPSIILIDEVNLPYATGCGGPLAWGSLLTTDGSDMSPKERLEIALTVAATVSPGCDGNIDVIKE